MGASYCFPQQGIDVAAKTRFAAEELYRLIKQAIRARAPGLAQRTAQGRSMHTFLLRYPALAAGILDDNSICRHRRRVNAYKGYSFSPYSLIWKEDRLDENVQTEVLDKEHSLAAGGVSARSKFFGWVFQFAGAESSFSRPKLFEHTGIAYKPTTEVGRHFSKMPKITLDRCCLKAMPQADGCTHV